MQQNYVIIKHRGDILKKQDAIEVQINDIKFPNIGITLVGDKKLQIKNTLPDKTAKMRVLKAGRAPKVDLLEITQPAI